MSLDRRVFLASSGAAAGVGLLGLSGCRSAPEPKPRFRLSLAEWSLHVKLKKKEMTNLEFAGVAGRFCFHAPTGRTTTEASYGRR